MAKIKKRVKSSPAAKENFFTKFSLDNYVPSKYQVPALIGIIVLIFIVFFSQLYFGGKTFQTGDIVQIEAAKKYTEQQRDGYSLWMPYIFCGMPAYAVGTEPKLFNLIYYAQYLIREKLIVPMLSVEYAKWSIYLILLSITSFLFMRHLTKNNLVSFFTAISTGLCTGLVVFLYIGHVTKLLELFIYPAIFLLLFRMQNKIKLIDVILLMITLQLAMQGFHAQIIFYMLFSVTVYFIYFFFRAVYKKETELRNKILKSAGVFIISAVVAVAIQSDDLTQIYEYTPYSTRGTESISDKAQQSDVDYYKYHTDWSFSPEEVLTFIVPSLYGFGNSTYKGSLTNDQPVDVNTYFGQMPFVDVAMYMGVLVFFLALFAVFTRWKDPVVQFLTILAGVSLLISFGKNFSFLFDLFFYNLPFFDKFRVPSMILVLVQLSMPVLAGLGLMKIISLRNEKSAGQNNILKKLAYIFTAVFVLSLLLNSAINDWFISRVNDYVASIQSGNPQLAQQFTALAEYISGMFTSDLLIAFGFSTVVFWLAYFYVNQKLSADFLIFSVIILTIIDLWRIDSRGAKYIDNPDIQSVFNQPGYITAIKNQNDQEPFRMFNLKQDNSYGSYARNSNFNAYFLIEDFYGYSGIKPRSFQDLMDVVGPVNNAMWRMLNVKYIIANNFIPADYLTLIDSSGGSFTYLFNNYLPRTYFVNSVEKLPDLEFLNRLKANSFDPKEKAFVHDVDLKVDPVDSTVYSKITVYKEDYLKADVNASGNNFLFFGNTYHPGWKASIDGKETKTYLTGHGYIGIIVPKGKHIVEFKFAPESFYLSKNVALALSSLLVIGLLFSVFKEARKRKSN